jgi:ribosomal protein L16/L10AE
MDKLERIELCLRILRESSEVSLTQNQLEAVRRVALTYLDAELGVSSGD